MPNLINVQHPTVGLVGAYISVCLLFLNIHGLDAAVLLVLILLAYTAVVLTFLLVLVHSFLANYFTSCTHKICCISGKEAMVVAAACKSPSSLTSGPLSCIFIILVASYVSSC
jgi:hypothetical protein